MINIIKKYLDGNQFSNLKEDFEAFYLSHPNYPSLYAVTDSLTLLGIENLAAKIPKEQFQELPELFMANYDNELVLVTKNEGKVIVETDKSEKKQLRIDEFLNSWDGIIVAIEANESNENIPLKKKDKQYVYFLPLLFVLIISIAYYGFSFTHLLYLFTTILGFVVSVFIVQEKWGINNETVSKFCTLASNTSCDSVIKSAQSNINKWISFSDLPLVFFGVNLLALLLNPLSVTSIGWLSMLSLPIILYSIWIQKIKLKKWCVLCLVISFIIIFQAILFFAMFHLKLHFSLSNLFFYSISMIIISAIWFWMKPIIEAKITLEKSNRDHIKFKRNFDLFNFLSKDIEIQEGFSQLNGIHFGNQTTDLLLTLILSPSCGHCHKAFKEGYELQQKYPEKVSLQVLFNINPENNNNPYTVVVERLLALSNSEAEKAQEAIIDWHIHRMSLESWKQKWDIASDMISNQQIYKQYEWCIANEFNYTPVNMVNNTLLPNEYQINELKYFLNDFSERNMILETHQD